MQIYDSKLKLDTGYGAVWERMDHYHDKRHHTYDHDKHAAVDV